MLRNFKKVFRKPLTIFSQIFVKVGKTHILKIFNVSLKRSKFCDRFFAKKIVKFYETAEKL